MAANGTTAVPAVEFDCGSAEGRGLGADSAACLSGDSERAVLPRCSTELDAPVHAPGASSSACEVTSDQGPTLDQAVKGLSRWGVTLLHAGVREVRHKMANSFLGVREGSEKWARDFVGGLAQDDAGMKEKAQVATSLNPAEAPERWWYSSCQDAHRMHTPEEDPPAPPERIPGFRGCLEVKVLALECDPPLLRTDGYKAIDPICQLSIDGRSTGGLRPADAGDDGQVTVCSARFPVHEVLGSDLRVNVFDRGCSSFTMGFEHLAFCGGALCHSLLYCIVVLAGRVLKGARTGCSPRFLKRG